MVGPRRFLRRIRIGAVWGEAQRVERTLATARALLAACSLVLVSFDPAQPVRDANLAYASLIVYLAGSLLILFSVRFRQPAPAFSLAVHGVDLLWAAAMTWFTGSFSLPFFFVFVLSAAAYRWGFREAMASAAASSALLLVQQALLRSGFQAQELEEASLLAGAAYLFPLGFLLGYLAEEERSLRFETSQAKAMDRALFARELHDGAIQSLIGLEVQVDALRRRASQQVGPMAQELARIQELLRGEVLNLRELMQQMKPLELGPRQLPDFLAEYVDKFWRDTGISASFVSDLTEVALPPRVCREIARIAQEALVNVRKHSGARNVVVRLSNEDSTWKLVIDDDGRGFDFAGRLSQAELDSSRKGPVIIKERVRSIGGELTIESTQGGGARLEISFSDGHG